MKDLVKMILLGISTLILCATTIGCAGLGRPMTDDKFATCVVSSDTHTEIFLAPHGSTTEEEERRQQLAFDNPYHFALKGGEEAIVTFRCEQCKYEQKITAVAPTKIFFKCNCKGEGVLNPYYPPREWIFLVIGNID